MQFKFIIASWIYCSENFFLYFSGVIPKFSLNSEINFEQSENPLLKQASVTDFPLFKVSMAVPNRRCFMYSDGGIPKKFQKLRSNVLMDMFETFASSFIENWWHMLSFIYRIASNKFELSFFSLLIVVFLDSFSISKSSKKYL